MAWDLYCSHSFSYASRLNSLPNRDELGFRFLKHYDMSSYNSVYFRLHSQEQRIFMLNLTRERSFSIELKRIFLYSLEGLYIFLILNVFSLGLL